MNSVVADVESETPLQGIVTVHAVPHAAERTLETIRRLAGRSDNKRVRGMRDLDRTGLLAAMESVRVPDDVSLDNTNYWPDVDREPLRTLVGHLRAELEDGLDLRLQDVTGTAFYQPGGFMGWHSNSTRPGRRLYCTWVETAETCFFRAYRQETDSIETIYEPAGWSIRSFRVPHPPEVLWHCIGAGSRRFALGFRFRPGSRKNQERE